MKKKLVVFSVEKEAPHTHSDYLRYGSTCFFFFLPKQNSRSKAFAKEDNRSGMPKVTPPRYLPYQIFVLPSFPPSLPHTPGLGTTSPARSSILSCFLAISSSAVCMSFWATYFSSGSVITYGRKSQGSFFRVGSKTRANGGNTMGPLLFWGWGIGWLFVCWRRIGRDGQTVMYVCVCVCVSVR